MAVLMGFVLTRMRSWGVELKVVHFHFFPSTIILDLRCLMWGPN